MNETLWRIRDLLEAGPLKLTHKVEGTRQTLTLHHLKDGWTVEAYENCCSKRECTGCWKVIPGDPSLSLYESLLNEVGKQRVKLMMDAVFKKRGM